MIKKANIPFKDVSILGAGVQGTPISLNYAIHGYNVKVIDISEHILRKVQQQHNGILNNKELLNRLNNVNNLDLSDKKNEILNRLNYTTDINEGVSDADLVVEMVPEDLSLKREVFSQLDKICPRKTILGTNSSSLRISQIEDGINRLDRVLNMHYFGFIVELMKGSKTTDQTIEKVYNFIHS
ncbi:MAG: 3-hydroxyacyl-CoA dehydrogenase family protein, partial [Promethearchaeota archaeon]